MVDEGSEVGAGFGRLLRWNRGTDYETVPSVKLREDLWNTCLISGGGGLLGGGLGTSFVSAHGSTFGIREGSVGRNMVGLTVGETYLEVLVKEYVMCDDK